MRTLKDYAYPTIMAEECLKALHKAVLDKDMGRARQMCGKALFWVQEIEESLKEMEGATKS